MVARKLTYVEFIGLMVNLIIQLNLNRSFLLAEWTLYNNHSLDEGFNLDGSF